MLKPIDLSLDISKIEVLFPTKSMYIRRYREVGKEPMSSLLTACYDTLLILCQ